MNNQFATLFLYLMIYSFLGWACESAYISIGRKKLINSGFLHGPFCPIYGFGAVFVILFLSPLSSYPILVFIMGVLITSLLEYFTSWLLEVLFHIMWWDYSRYKYNINGRVCLLNSFLFGCMSIFVIYVLHPFVVGFVSQWSWILIQQIALVLLIYLAIDFIISTLQLVSFKQQLVQFETKLSDIKQYLAKQLPQFNFDAKEKIEVLFETTPDLAEIKEQLHQSYSAFRQYRKQHRLRNSFPHLKLSNKQHLQGFSEYIKKVYEKDK